MKLIATALSFLLAMESAQASTTFEGMWLTCLPERGSRQAISLLTVTPQKDGFRVVSETGTIWSFSGEGKLVKGELVVRGCDFSRDQPMFGCDPNKPPVALVMKKSVFKNKQGPLLDALRKSFPIRTSHAGWEKLAAECERIADELATMPSNAPK